MKKYVVMLGVSITIMLGMMVAIPFLMAKASAEAEILAKAERDLKESRRIAAVKVNVESVVSDFMPKVVQRLDFPDRFYTLVTQMVNKNPDIVGVGVAFLPDYYADKGKETLYAPYAYDEQPSIKVKKKKTEESQIRTRLLDFDYTTREWFKMPIHKEKSLWTQPYVDQGGTKIIMCTYVEPIRNRNGHVVAQFGPVIGSTLWDGCGEDGERLPTGLYNIYCAQGGQPETTGTPHATIMIIK